MFAEGTDPLIKFSGDAGRFFNSALTRESLIAIQGPEKRGKTFWCMEFMMRALRQRRKVAFFQVGDLSQRQVLMRFGARVSGMPLWPNQCGDIRYPKSIKIMANVKGQNVVKHTSIKYKTKTCDQHITQEICEQSVKRFLRHCGLSKKHTHLMISDHPSGTATVRDIEGILDQWEVEKSFIPDIIIIDYADILAPESRKHEGRDRTNETWMALRRLSQERRVLVISPTQADASSYDRHIQSMKNFSEDKRKLAHVTGLFGLNQDDREKEQSIMRLNWIVLRESAYNIRQCLYVGQCLPLGRMVCCSSLMN